MNLPHYNTIFKQVFQKQGLDLRYQPGCLIRPYNGSCWDIQYPDLTDFGPSTVILMHCQDFVSVDMQNNLCPELVQMEKYFGDKSSQVVVVHWNIDLNCIYQGQLNLVYFPTHSYELLCNLKNTQKDWQPPYEQFHLRKGFQCLNGLPKPHRKHTVEWLTENNLQGLITLGDQIPCDVSSYDKYKNSYSNEDNWMRLQSVYTKHSINIVTETMYEEYPGIITEKTLMAVLAKQIPLLIGYPKMVEHFKQLGFDTFEDIVNTNYDNMPNEVRLQSALTSNKSLLENFEYTGEIIERLNRNQHYLLNHWLDKLITDFEIQVNRIIQEKFLN